ncbi:hypothetical protein [Glycomyces sp. NRRL B-16210]|uniref:hypothetical protein n=1 Tax=Glycomyces sp. NRRL B-16210 TaxID=1463821 RepID=UPI00105CA806|nr:hypothetical protein [Glycomyces sp. NRRL B-16210]
MTDQHPQADPSKPRRGRVRRWVARALRNLLRFAELDATTPSPELTPTRSVNQTETFAFETPSKGDAYDFLVAADLCFCATGMLSTGSLDAKIRDRVPAILAEVKSVARRTGRDYPPFRPGAAEPEMTTAVQQAVETVLAGIPDEEGAVLTCTVKVRVDMPEVVREMQRLAVADQVKFEARYEQSEQTAQRLGELREVWTTFIRDGLSQWETPYAIHMAQQPEQATATLYKMRGDRKQEASELVEVVGAVGAGHEKLDLLDFVLASDRALRQTFELFGIARPDEGPASAFDDADGDWQGANT